MAFAKADPETIALLERTIPVEAGIELKPMFGHKAAFVNGNMFAGTYGDAIVLRLGEEGSAALLAKPGTRPFEPMAGRAMKGYVCVEPAKLGRRLRSWIERALAYTRELPAKKKKPRKATKTIAAAKPRKRA